MRLAPFARLSRKALEEGSAFVRRDAGWSTDVLKGPALRARQRRIEWSRHLVQAGFLLVVLLIGWEFVGWVHGMERGLVVGERPPGVEGFLPIAALLSLRHLATTGEVHPVHPAGLAILLLVVGVSVLAKKAFCSWVCPVGTLSEMLAGLSRRLFRRTLGLPRLLDLPLRSLKYLLLAFFVYAVFLQMGPAAVADFLDSPYNRVADVKMLYFFERLSPFALKVILGLVAFSLIVPYAWCRYLCPYGALLGALSLLSPLKVTRHAPSCIDCNLCTKACPSRLPVARLARVSSDECFGCLSCVAACPVPRALRVETPAPWRRAVRPAAFAALVVGLFASGVLLARATGHWRNTISNEEYAHRIRTIDSPAYDHLRGRVPSREEWEAAEKREKRSPGPLPPAERPVHSSDKEARALARIVVVGSVAQDDVVTLRQPLAAGCHLDAAGRKLRLGGGGANTAIPLRHAGHEVALVAPVGGDDVAEWLLAKLQGAGIDVSAVVRVPGGSTRSLVLVDPGGERTIVNLHRCRETGPPERLASLEADAVYVRSRDLDVTALLAEAAGRSLVVAHVPPLQAGSRPAHVLVGSESDLPPEFLADPWAAGREIAGLALRLVVVTRGERGAVAYGATGAESVSAPHVTVVDSTAAGDVFAAGLVHALAEGRSTRAALETAVAWGAAAVACPGVPGREAIQGLL